ncbi:MAG: sulfate ABC transporter permease subunit CysT [Anaerolineae bacterium]|nr:sulfate ABC transporter permease subunit CysT [Anaerolineae bacterium]
MAEQSQVYGSSNIGEQPPSSRPYVPGFGAWGLRLMAISYLTVFIVIPLLVVNVQGLRFGLDVFWQSISRPEAVSALTLSVTTSLVMTVINTVMGTLTAYVLVRYKFPGKTLFNTLVDLPFAIPTLVIGVMLVLLYGPQTIVGKFLQQELGVRILFDTPGIVIALLLVGYPFVIRAVQPVLLQMDSNQTDVAQTIGASPWTTFRRVIFPIIRPAMVTGALLSFARSLGEFGSIIVVAGNIPMRSQTGTVYVYTQVEAGNMQAASSVSMVLLLVAFAATIGIDMMNWRRHARN